MDRLDQIEARIDALFLAVVKLQSAGEETPKVHDHEFEVFLCDELGLDWFEVLDSLG